MMGAGRSILEEGEGFSFMENFESLFYPVIGVSEDGVVAIKLYLPRDYKDSLPDFYKAGYRPVLERYTETIRKTFFADLELVWDKAIGIIHINLRPSAGLDLNQRGRFEQHNVGSLEQAVPLFLVGTKYVSLLLES